MSNAEPENRSRSQTPTSELSSGSPSSSSSGASSATIGTAPPAAAPASPAVSNVIAATQAGSFERISMYSLRARKVPGTTGRVSASWTPFENEQKSTQYCMNTRVTSAALLNCRSLFLSDEFHARVTSSQTFDRSANGL
eukprot:Amastigsp_a174522_384.p4 type:complete len:139 gc:universal Amastigsp_a174522_384:408-824(+)